MDENEAGVDQCWELKQGLNNWAERPVALLQWSHLSGQSGIKHFSIIIYELIPPVFQLKFQRLNVVGGSFFWLVHLLKQLQIATKVEKW